MAVGARIILGPVGVAFQPVSPGATAEPDAEADLGIHQPGEDELSLLPIVGGQGKVVILHSGEFTKRSLEGVQASEERDYASGERPDFRDSHGNIPDESVAD